MKRAAASALFAFFVVMACFGMLSRAVEANGIAVVTTTTPEIAADDEGNRTTRIPLEALRWDEDGQPYVLTVEELPGPFGNVLTACRKNVAVQGGDELFAVLEDGALSPDQELVARATREVVDGDRVRRLDD